MSKAVEPASSESPTLLSLSSTSPSDWSYLSEGGANVILSYNGPYLSAFFSKVIRVRKRAGGVAIVGGEAELFRTRVVPQLLGEQFLLRAQVVEVGREWLDGLESSLRDGRKRESSRENDEGGDWDQRVELLDDLVTGKGVLSVEIKVRFSLYFSPGSSCTDELGARQPKWLFLPPSSASRSIKEQHCRYCMHTCLRNERDHNASIARERHDEGYCPLDLASGVPSRIERSINGLWKAWVNSNGQNNNLRLFLNGSVIQPGVVSPPPLAPRPFGAPVDANSLPRLQISNDSTRTSQTPVHYLKPGAPLSLRLSSFPQFPLPHFSPPLNDFNLSSSHTTTNPSWPYPSPLLTLIPSQQLSS